MRESWLNGWFRNGATVLMGTGVHCAGCGRTLGITCVVISENYVFPEKKPDWSFEEVDCPVCKNVKIDMLEIIPTSALREEIAKRMKKVGMK